MRIDLTGKTVLVTGASRGIGKAIAEALAESGATVAVHFNQNEKEALTLVSRLGNGSFAFQADLSNPLACIRLFESVTDKFKKLDVLVNNAGMAVSSPMDMPDEQWLEDWEITFAVNLTSAAVLTKKAVAHFLAGGGGRLIHIASRAAFRGDVPEYLAYAASKGGLVSLSRSVARAYGKQGICSFLLAPGFVRTDMAQGFINEFGEEIVLHDIALRQLTEPGNIAPFVVLLASGLGDHATGCTIDINAGSYVR